MNTQTSFQIKAGQTAPLFSVEDITGKKIILEQWKGKKVYLTFLRNTACPLCSFHVFRLLKLADKLKQNNMEVVAFYESKKNVILSSPFFKDQVVNEKKMHVVSDLERKVYDVYGAEINTAKATLEVLSQHGRMEVIQAAAKAGFTGDGIQPGTNAAAIPADFLINEDLTIALAHYGIDAGDNIALELVEKFAEQR